MEEILLQQRTSALFYLSSYVNIWNYLAFYDVFMEIITYEAW